MMEELNSEQISLTCSIGPGQMSFFDNPPESCTEINSDNAILISIKDSILFNDVYQKTLLKFQQKQMERQSAIANKNLKKEEVKVIFDEDKFKEEKGVVMSSHAAVSPIGKSVAKQNDASASNSDHNVGSQEEVKKPLQEEPKEEPKELHVEEIKKELKEEPNVEPPVAIKEEIKVEPKVEPKKEVEEEVKIEPKKEPAQPEAKEEVKLTMEDIMNKLNGEPIIEEPADPDDENEVLEDLDFTIIDFDKEKFIGFQLDTIQEDDEEGVGDSVMSAVPQRNFVKVEYKKEDNIAEEELDSSFEMIHSHDIKIIDEGYLIRESVMN